jgi:hypothetical protein
MAGACSILFSNVRSGWPSSYGYYSNDNCATGAGNDDLLTVEHACAALIYYDSTGALSSVGAPLSTTYATHSAPAVSASTYLYHGRQLSWLAGTTSGNWYDVVQFHVVWSYYVLV